MNEKNVDDALNIIEPVLEKLNLEDLQYILVYLIASSATRLSDGDAEAAKSGLDTFINNVSSMVDDLSRLH